MLTWAKFLSKLRRLPTPYKGDDDDFEAVREFLKGQGMSTETVNDGDTDTSWELEALYRERKGKVLDVSDVAAEAAQEAKMREMVLEVVGEVGAIRGTAKTHHTHDVKVGKERLADDPKGGFKSIGHFFKDVITAGREGMAPPDELERWTKTAATTYGSESVGADGGFAVPTEFRTEITKKVEGEESILTLTNRLRTSSNSLVVPYDPDEPWSSNGIQAEWSGEAATMTQRKPLLQQREFRLRKLVCLVPVTDELMDDAAGIGSYVADKAGDVISFRVGEAIFRGTGSTQPLGFLNAASTVSQAAAGSQVADTITGLNILNMYSRMYSPWRRNSVWFASPTAAVEIMRASIQGRADSGTALTGYGGMLFVPQRGEAPFPTVLGRPLIFTEHCEEVGDVGDIIFASMGQYATLTKGDGGIQAMSSMHIWFDQDLTALKFRIRVDGQPWPLAAITPRDTDSSAKTLGAFITLAAR